MLVEQGRLGWIVQRIDCHARLAHGDQEIAVLYQVADLHSADAVDLAGGGRGADVEHLNPVTPESVQQVTVAQ